MSVAVSEPRHRPASAASNANKNDLPPPANDNAAVASALMRDLEVSEMLARLEVLLGLELKYRGSAQPAHSDNLTITSGMRDGSAHVLRCLKVWYDLPAEVFFSAVSSIDRFLTKMKVLHFQVKIALASGLINTYALCSPGPAEAPLLHRRVRLPPGLPLLPGERRPRRPRAVGPGDHLPVALHPLRPAPHAGDPGRQAGAAHARRGRRGVRRRRLKRAARHLAHPHQAHVRHLQDRGRQDGRSGAA